MNYCFNFPAKKGKKNTGPSLLFYMSISSTRPSKHRDLSSHVKYKLAALYKCQRNQNNLHHFSYSRFVDGGVCLFLLVIFLLS